MPRRPRRLATGAMSGACRCPTCGEAIVRAQRQHLRQSAAGRGRRSTALTASLRATGDAPRGLPQRTGAQSFTAGRSARTTTIPSPWRQSASLRGWARCCRRFAPPPPAGLNTARPEQPAAPGCQGLRYLRHTGTQRKIRPATSRWWPRPDSPSSSAPTPGLFHRPLAAGGGFHGKNRALVERPLV